MPASRVLLNGSFAPSVVNFRGQLIRDLIAEGYEIHVSVPDLTPRERAAIGRLGAVAHESPLQRTGMSIIADLAYFRHLKRLIGEINPSLVVSYTIKPNIWGSLAAASAGVRSASMVTGLGYTFIQSQTLKQRAVAAVSRLLYRRATAVNDVVVFQNPDDRDDFVKAGCLADPGKARMVNGSGVDTEWFRPTPLPAAPVFLMAARLLVSKGVREYASAALALLSRRSDCRFLLVGNLDDSPDCISELELREWQRAGMEYLGWSDDIRREISEASVFVLPSYREGTPRAVLEAAAMGRPVVTTDAPGCRETVISGKTGLLIPPRSAEALQDALEQLADAAGLRQAMGKRARDFCVAKYAVRKVNRALMSHLGLV
jgi:glycosyltransferase involved in cell wall biosynthesis